jgi:hypothetical protein
MTAVPKEGERLASALVEALVLERPIFVPVQILQMISIIVEVRRWVGLTEVAA